MKPYKLPRMSEEEIEMLLDRERICRIAFKGEEFPYLAPFQYVRIGDALYFHFTDYGRKMRLLEKDNRVCVGVENLEPDLCEYSFVVLRGELERIEDTGERAEAIRRLAGVGFPRTSSLLTAFRLSRAGKPSRRRSRWSSLSWRGSRTE